MESFAVPFSYDFVRVPNWTSHDVQGMLRTEPDGLVIEFREERDDAASSEPHVQPVQTLVIPWSEVQSVAVKEPWLRRPSILLRTRNLRALEGLPEARGSDVALPIARSDRGLARELAAFADAALAEHRLRALDALEPPRSLPPG